jgi:hypothetical protein
MSLGSAPVLVPGRADVARSVKAQLQCANGRCRDPSQLLVLDSGSLACQESELVRGLRKDGTASASQLRRREYEPERRNNPEVG